jgi:hypothetical protein
MNNRLIGHCPQSAISAKARTKNVTPATLLRWYLELAAKKWTFLERRQPGRPRTKADIEELVVRVAHENPSWGNTRTHGLRNLDIKVGRETIRRILKDYLIEPAPASGPLVIPLDDRNVPQCRETAQPSPH